MKKIKYLFLILLLTGCGTPEKNDILYDDSYYQIASPYKDNIGSYSLTSYDKNEVDIMLMNLSTNYFKINNSYYQNGQYLTTDELKYLVNLYNETDFITIDNIEITPKYILSIYEQDYLNVNNELKGISLAIVVTNKLYVNNTYKIVDEDMALEYAKEKANDLVEYMYQKEEVKDKKIVIGIFLQSNSVLKGTFKYIGEVSNGNLNLNYVNYNYRFLDTNYIMNNDLDTYNSILALKQSLKDYNNLYINTIGLYKDDELVKVNIDINKSYFKTSEILSISNTIENYINEFDEVNVYFKSGDELKAYLIKQDGKIENYVMEE